MDETPGWNHYDFTFSDGSSGSDEAAALNIYGYGGDDTIELNACDGSIAGGAGSDTIKLTNSPGVAVAPMSPNEVGEDLNDTITVVDSEFCGIEGGPGSDIFNLEGDCSYSELYGGTEADTVKAAANTVFRHGKISLGDGANVVTAAGDWTAAEVKGGKNIDTIDCRLASGGLTIAGFEGADKLRGSSGDDYIIGGKNLDTIYGMAGDDFIDAWDNTAKNDVIDGGDGNDNCQTDIGGEARIIRCEVVFEYIA